MDSIDITDLDFSLSKPHLNESVVADYSIFLYIGAAILVIFIAMFIYKFYQNKKTSQEDSELDCTGGFCTMNKCHV